MGFIDIVLIGVGLSMDAFAVSVCKGLKMKVIDMRQCFVIALFFGVFQAFMPLAGYALSVSFVTYINAYSHWIAFGLLVIIGANMIRESVGDEEEEECGNASVGIKELILLAIATSIDALAVGVSFAALSVNIWLAACFICCITVACCLLGHALGRRFGLLLGARAQLCGGAILVAIGVKILIEHLTGG